MFDSSIVPGYKKLFFVVAPMLGIVACSGAPGGNADDSALAEDVAAAEQALGTPSIPCPAVTIKHNGNVVATPASGGSSISFGATKILCSVTPSFDPVRDVWEWPYSPPREGARTDGGTVKILEGGVVRRSYTCASKSFASSATGWGGTTVPSTARANILGSKDGPNGQVLLVFSCTYNVAPNAAYIQQNRPATRPNDVLVAANRGFYRRPALTSSEISSGCNNICNQQCTYNLQPGSNGQAIAKCINDCNAQCVR